MKNELIWELNKNEISKKINKIGSLIKQFKNSDSISLMGGYLGLSLFLFYYSRYLKKEDTHNMAYQLIEDAFENTQQFLMHKTFASGLAGLGWLMEHLSQNDFLEIDTTEAIGELDGFLSQYMFNEIKQGNYDYLHSAGGIALYLLRRKPQLIFEKQLTEYIDILFACCDKENDTIKWKSEFIKKDKLYTRVFNLSLSHGIASIISILSKIYERNINKEKTGDLLKGAINYLLVNQFDIKNNLSYFPNTISSKRDKDGPSRLAWCYGDLGISVALWNASKALSDSNLERKAIEILLHSSKRRNLKENYIMDAGLCHGTAGIAHIFNRMYFNTGIPEFKETSIYWFNETLKMAKFEDGLAGFKVWRTQEYGGWTKDYGLLEGIAGIGLAMISAISDIEPKWDECLLL